MHLRVVEFLSAVFARFNVTFYLEYHCTAVSEVSTGKKWSVNPFQTPKVQETEYTFSSGNFGNYEKKEKKIKWVILQNLHTLVLRWCSEMKIGETWSFSFCLARDQKSLPQRRIVADIFGKEVDCIGEKFVPQTACWWSEVNKNKFGSSRNILSRRAQMWTEICIKLFTRTRI